MDQLRFTVGQLGVFNFIRMQLVTLSPLCPFCETAFPSHHCFYGDLLEVVGFSISNVKLLSILISPLG